MRVVVLGGGAIGASIAYRLAERGADVVVVECYAVAGAASGKSGGFLALDWCDGTPLETLARRSFALHAEFADAQGGQEWGYRRMTTFAGTIGRPTRHLPLAPAPDWVGDGVTIEQRIGTPRSTAQVHPARFTSAIMRAAETHGAVLRMGRATGLVRQGERVCGVQLEDETLSADAVVIAMGPWSALASEWLQLPPVYGLKGHSLVFETGSRLPAEALFLDYADPVDGTLSPEVFPARGWHDLCLRRVQRVARPGRPGPGRTRPGRARPADRLVRPRVARARQLAHRRFGRMLPPGDGRRPTPDRRDRRRRPGLRGDRAQRVGDPERARYRRGDGRVGAGRHGADR